jgi:hypothetical protein
MNHWTSRKDPLATWRASIGGDEQRALRWLERVLEAGEAHAVYLSRDALRGRDLRELLRAFSLSHYDHAAQRYPAGARMAIHDRDGAPLELLVDDLGALSRSLHPELREDEWLLELRCRPPVAMELFARRDGRLLEIALHSDLWMPWIWGFLEEEHRFPDGPVYDNRDLAANHTPRLNAFLAEVRAISDSFEVARDEGQAFYYAWCVSELGIDLASRPPTQ